MRGEPAQLYRIQVLKQKGGNMAQFDTIIKGGTVVDGTRVPRYKAEIGIKDDKITEIGRIKRSDAKKVTDD